MHVTMTESPLLSLVLPGGCHCREAESERLIHGESSSRLREETPALQETSGYGEVDSQWWEHNQMGHALRKKKQKEIQRWLRGIPWGSYLNMPTLAAIAGLSVG